MLRRTGRGWGLKRQSLGSPEALSKSRGSEIDGVGVYCGIKLASESINCSYTPLITCVPNIGLSIAILGHRFVLPRCKFECHCKSYFPRCLYNFV
jgi:hypothetical protein